jgi:predicted Fe-Mo cluster-binding NifX family protein
MKIAIATDNNNVSEHFGRCPSYTIFETKENMITNKKKIDNPGHEPGKIPNYLNDLGIKVIIAGGMGQKAVSLFEEYDIKVIVGATGKIEDVMKSYIENNLVSKESTCQESSGKNYGIEKNVCDHK